MIFDILYKIFETRKNIYNHLIKKGYNNPNEIINKFNDPTKEKYIEWMVKQYLNGYNINDINKIINNYHNIPKQLKKDINQLSYNEVKDIINKKSNRQFNKDIKNNGIDGLKINKDYFDITTDIKNILYKEYKYDKLYAYIPINYKACNKISSKYISDISTKWCIALSNSDFYWKLYIHERKATPIIIINETLKEKYLIMIYNDKIDVWDKTDNEDNNKNPKSTIPYFNLNDLNINNLNEYRKEIDKYFKNKYFL